MARFTHLKLSFFQNKIVLTAALFWAVISCCVFSIENLAYSQDDTGEQAESQEESGSDEDESKEEESSEETEPEDSKEAEETDAENQEKEEAEQQDEGQASEQETEPTPDQPKDEDTETPYKDQPRDKDGEKDSENSEMKDSDFFGKEDPEGLKQEEPTMTPIDKNGEIAPPVPRYQTQPDTEKETSETDQDKSIETGFAKDKNQKAKDTDKNKTEKEKALAAERKLWSYGASLSYSRLVDPVNTGESVSYSGNLGRKSEDGSSWALSISVGQPLYFDEPLSLGSIGWSKRFAKGEKSDFPISISYAGSVVGIEKIEAQGYRIHNNISFRQIIYRNEKFYVLARVAPFYLFSEYSQTLTGEDYTLFGASESISAAMSFGDISIFASTGLQQGYRGSKFKYTNSNSQSVSYVINDSWNIGLSHSVSTLIIDQDARTVEPNILLGHAENSLFAFYLSYSKRSLIRKFSPQGNQL